jgi:mannose-6-phosphate isomerase-like protein (cupin superfamily)
MARETYCSNLDKEFAAVHELWSPRVVAIANGQCIKVAKVEGEFVWHAHAGEDEVFLVRKGTLVIRYRDRPDVTLNEGDFHVVPRGVEHMTAAPRECWVVLFEPAATKHTGETATEMSKSIEAQMAHLRSGVQTPRADCQGRLGRAKR